MRLPRTISRQSPNLGELADHLRALGCTEEQIARHLKPLGGTLRKIGSAAPLPTQESYPVARVFGPYSELYLANATDPEKSGGSLSSRHVRQKKT